MLQSLDNTSTNVCYKKKKKNPNWLKSDFMFIFFILFFFFNFLVSCISFYFHMHYNTLNLYADIDYKVVV